MKQRTRSAAVLAAVLVLAVALSLGACGKRDAIRETQEILSAAENFTFIYTIEGRDSTQKIAIPYLLAVTADAASEENAVETTYATISPAGATIWALFGDTYVPTNYSFATYRERTRGADSYFGMFLSYLDPGAWKWDKRRDAFVPKDYGMFAPLGLEVTDMELAITDTTCSIMGQAVKTDRDARYEVIITMAVTHIGTTEVTLPSEVTAD